MTELAHPDDVYVDHLPDGTILGEMPFNDAEKLLALLRERMTPENYAIFTKELITLYAQKYPEEMREFLAERQ